MNWTNVRLIFFREVRDQLRDRRTMFMIAVLPIMLYPLLGMSFFQMAQFRREHVNTVLVVGTPPGDVAPPLLDKDRFAEDLFSDPQKARLLEVRWARRELPARGSPAQQVAEARRAVQAGQFDVALYFPDDFVQRLAKFRAAIARRQSPDAAAAPSEVPSPEIIYTTANDRSQIAFARLAEILRRWTERVGSKTLEASGIPPTAARPFELKTDDMATAGGHRGAAAWSKILPVLLLIWALTGAFYPAIDLCAGEKERGTLETLLCSPAQRTEIVVGKLLTIMGFSAITAALNLISIGLTGWLFVSMLQKETQLAGFGPPPPLAPLWLLLALLPVAALFSALSLALAAFAKSTKEGQYYLMPLLLVTMPLAILPAAPGVELTLGNSLIPITGMVLLLRSLLEGNYWPALQFAAPVVAVTMAGCVLAVRWAVDQFNSEAVLFREGERLDLGLWLHHLLRDRQPTPTVAAAVFCGATILLVRFFVGMAMPAQGGIDVVIGIVAAVLTPALLMTVMFTSSPRQTLLLRWPAWMALPAAAVLAVALRPLIIGVNQWLYTLYPLSPEIELALKKLAGSMPGLGQMLIVFALVPAVCEELAFRGFILSGMRHLGHKWRAIVYSAIFFGVTHAIFQQWISAALLGCVLGYLAVQSGSLLTCVVFHFVHNGLTLLLSRVSPADVERWPALRWLMAGESDVSFHWGALLLGTAVAGAILWWFGRLRYQKSAEETLQDAIDRGQPGAVASTALAVTSETPLPAPLPGALTDSAVDSETSQSPEPTS